MNTRYMNPGGCEPKEKPKKVPHPDMPIGMAYVPWQTWKDVMDGYSGLNHGTIFEELVLPFGGYSAACSSCGGAPHPHNNYNNYNRRGMK